MVLNYNHSCLGYLQNNSNLKPLNPTNKGFKLKYCIGHILPINIMNISIKYFLEENFKTTELPAFNVLDKVKGIKLGGKIK